MKLEPLESSIKTSTDYQAARLGIQKTFSGDMIGTSVGEMLALGTPAGAGGYVASDLVSATLEGRSGSFVMQHLGTRTKTEQHLKVEIVPESGTAGLVGITGTFAIRIEGGQHFYDLSYDLE